MRVLWITWYPHRRTSGLCAAWNVPLCVITSQRKGAAKRVDEAWQTLKLLWRHKPQVLFVQNPSFGCTALAVLVRPLFGFFLVVDAHNEGVRPHYIHPGAFDRWLTRRFLLPKPDVTIVTNEALARDVVAAGGRPLVLPDCLPALPALQPVARSGGAGDVAVIATFAPDEPIKEILAAAATMPEVRFAFTGNAAKFAALGLAPPPNVRLTGFLPEHEYWELLARTDVICDLTLMDDCLVCGAYEGLVMGKAMVLSNNPPTRDLFGAAAVLANNDTDGIARALRSALEQRDSLETRAREARETFRAKWQKQATEVWGAIRARAAASGKVAKSEAVEV